MVSGMDREQAALDAGANAFVNYDEWLRLGGIVDTVLLDEPRLSSDASEVA
jgi:hypothetical protein